MEQELPTGSGERQIAQLVEHHEVEPAELSSDGASLADASWTPRKTLAFEALI
jgi:hypothetical protein